MKNLSSALMWGGLALFLLPFAVICLALMVAIGIAFPPAGIALAVIVFVIAREAVVRRRASAAESRPDAAEGEGRR
jgi:uncharacterized membrane protein